MVEGLVGQQVTYEDNPQTPNLVFIPLARNSEEFYEKHGGWVPDAPRFTF